MGYKVGIKNKIYNILVRIKSDMFKLKCNFRVLTIYLLLYFG